MEDKHIYSTSFWSKLQDRFNDLIKEIKNFTQDLKPKRTRKTFSPISMEPITKEIPQTPVTTTVSEVKIEKPKTKKVKSEKPKKERGKKFHYRKMADERVQKTLVFSLAFAIISIFGVGTFLSHKDSLNFQKTPKTTNQPQKVSSTPTPNITSNWKTYTNEKYHFTFKYPSDWVSQPIASENTISQFGEYFEGGEPGGSSPLYFYISIEPYETIFAQDIKNDGTEVINQEKVRIDNKILDLNTHKQFEVEAAYKIIDYIPIKDINRAGLYLYFSHTDAGCSVLPSDAQAECLKENDKNNVIYRNIRNQILSTFKFLE